jgi:hypothetical protein
MLVANLVAVWQFRRTTAPSELLNEADQLSLAAMTVHLDVDTLGNRLAALADINNGPDLLKESESLRKKFLADVTYAQQLFTKPGNTKHDPVILSTLQTLKVTLPSQIDKVEGLAEANDWPAVRLRLDDQVQGLTDLGALLLERVDMEVSRQRAEALESARRASRQLLMVLPLTALLTMLLAILLGWRVTWTITEPLAELHAGAQALARGDFQYEVHVGGNDELAVVGRAFNHAARQLQEFYEELREQASLLNLTHDAVYVRDMKGVIGYWNRGAEVLYGWPAEHAVGKVAHELLKTVSSLPFEKIEADLLRTGGWEGELVKTKKDGTQLVVASRCSLKRDDRGEPVAILVTSNDISERKRAEEALRRLNRELRAISDCNQTLLRATDEQTLLERICRIVCEEAGYRLAWVGYAEHDAAKSVRPVAWTGAEEGYLASAGITWADTDRGRGHTGTAIRSGKSCCIQDFAMDPRLAPWQEGLLQRGFRSGIALPLKDENDNAFGSLTIHSAQPNAFTSEEIRLLEELSGDLAFGIVTLRSQAARKRAEQEVTLLSFALDKVREAAFLVDDTGRFRYVNEDGCRVLGYTREELLGMGVPDIDPGFPAGRWSDHWRDLKAQRSLNFESRHRTRDGRIFPVEVSANYFEYAGRAYNLALVRDITERKRAEETIRQHEAELRQVLDLAPQLVAVFGPGRERLYANRPTLDYFGVTLEEWRSISDPFRFFHPDDRERLTRHLYPGPDTGGQHEFEARFRKGDGTYRWFLFRDNPVRDKEGRISRWYLAATDIEDRKRAEEERRTQVWFLESMDRINRAMQGTNDLDQVTSDVVDAMLSIFNSERAFLYYPCDPDAPSFEAVMVRTRPEYEAARGVMPMTPDTAKGFQIMRASSGVVTFGPGCDYPLIGDFAKRFGHKSSIGIALYPKTGRPWVLAMHQCSYPRVWTPDERKLVEEIARRLEDSLTSLLMFRSLCESEEALRQSESYLAEAQRLSHTGSWAFDIASDRYVYASEECLRIFGFEPQEALPTREAVFRRIHPDDSERVNRGFEKSVHEKVDNSDEFRIVLPDGAVKTVHVIRHPVAGSAGDVVKLFGTAVDITERKRAEEKLQQSEAELRQIVDAVPQHVVVLEPDGEFSYVNRRDLEYTGLTLKDVYAADYPARIFHPNDWERLRDDRQHALAQGILWEAEARLLGKDGQYRWFLIRLNPLRDEQGHIIRWYGTRTDITERKRAEEALRRSEAYLAEAERINHTGTWAWNPASGIQYWSKECYGIMGFDPAEGMPRLERFLEAVHPEDRPRLRERLQRVAGEKTTYETEYRIIRPSGEVRDLRVIGHPVFDSAGNLLEYVGTTADVTERKRAEETLRESETRFRTFVDHAGDALFVMDREGTIVDLNQAACEGLGYTRQELIGKTSVAFHLDSEGVQMESVAERAAAGETVVDAHYHRRKDGTVFPVEANTSSFWYGGRRFLLHVSRDITDRLRAEEERERLRQLEADLAHIDRVSILGELTASIAHEVNQPLSGIVSSGSACLRWLARDVPDLEEAREAARRIVRDGKRAGEIIARIRALTKKAAASREKLDLNETIREVLALVGDEAKGNAVVIRTRFGDDVFPVVGDQVQLQQVVLNLAMNAIEAMSSVGDRARELVITTGNIDSDQVQVTVEDSGTGIAPQMIEKIFDSFYTTKPGGMGMGLSVSRSILQAHGGRLWATAKDGPGTSFHFTLPRYDESSHAAA